MDEPAMASLCTASGLVQGWARQLIRTKYDGSSSCRQITDGARADIPHGDLPPKPSPLSPPQPCPASARHGWGGTDPALTKSGNPCFYCFRPNESEGTRDHACHDRRTAEPRKLNVFLRPTDFA